MKYNFDKKVCRESTHCTKWHVLHNDLDNKHAIPMWIADMDFPIANSIQKALTDRMKCPIYGYTVENINCKINLQSWNKKRYNYEFNTDDVTLISGVLPGLSAAIRIFSNENDKVMILLPSYQPFVKKTLANNREPIFSDMKIVDGTYLIDFDDLENKVSAQCKIFILCNPHNPTGRAFTIEELTQLALFCEKHQLKIISDEIHSDFIMDNNNYNNFININEYTKNNTISLVSTSKSFNLAGLKIAAAIIKNKQIQSKFIDESDKVGSTNVNLFAQCAFESAYGDEDSEDWFNQLLSYVNENQNYCYEFIKTNLPNITHHKAEATYLLWLDFEKYSDKFVDLQEFILNEANVYVTPGISFGDQYKNFIRLNLGCPKTTVIEVLNNIKDALDKL